MRGFTRNVAVVVLGMGRWAWAEFDTDLKAVIEPAVPRATDPITIHVSRTDGWPVRVVDSQFSKRGNELELGFTLQSLPLPVVVHWKFDKEIGVLPEGPYELLTTIRYTDSTFTETARTSFTVVPEPGGGWR